MVTTIQKETMGEIEIEVYDPQVLEKVLEKVHNLTGLHREVKAKCSWRETQDLEHTHLQGLIGEALCYFWDEARLLNSKPKS